MLPRELLNNRGFTLVEVMVSVVIFAIGILSVLIMLLQTIKGNAASITMTNAAQLASKQIEEIMLMNYNAITDTDGDGVAGLDDIDVSTAEGTNLNLEIGGLGKRYNVYWNIAENWPVTDTKTIRVIVTWQEGNRNKQVAFDFIKTLGG